MSVSANNAIVAFGEESAWELRAGLRAAQDRKVKATRPGRIAKGDAPKVRPLIESTVQVALAATLVALMQKRPRNPSRQNLELRG